MAYPGGGYDSKQDPDAYSSSSYQHHNTHIPMATAQPAFYTSSTGVPTQGFATQPTFYPASAGGMMAAQSAFVHHQAPYKHGRGGGGAGEGYYDEEAGGYGGGGAGGGTEPGVVPASGFMEKAEGQMRLAFLRKVYTILSCQLLLTIGMACLFSFNDAVNNFIMTTPQLSTAALVLSFVSLIALFCFRHKHPMNMILLGVWTVIMGYSLGLVCAMYYRQGAGELVLQAFGITAGIFLGLTAYTLYSKRDFSFMGGFLFAGLIGLMVWGLVSWLTGWRSTFWYSLIGALLFSALIVYDTFLISKRLSPDEYILGAISLYLDIINLFLFILQLLGGNRRD
jgi:FtsH-binding integral membrane protein